MALDTWQLLPNDIGGGPFSRTFAFDLGEDPVVVPERPNSVKPGSLQLFVVPTDHFGTDFFGFASVAHDAWDRPAITILVVGIQIPLLGIVDWRFWCPIKKTCEQVVFYDPTSMLFVSRAALGSPAPRSFARRVLRVMGQQLELDFKYGAFDKKPPRTRPETFEAAKLKMANAPLELLCALSGLPQGTFDNL